jgi:hypothetical protein
MDRSFGRPATKSNETVTWLSSDKMTTKMENKQRTHLVHASHFM